MTKTDEIFVKNPIPSEIASNPPKYHFNQFLGKNERFRMPVAESVRDEQLFRFKFEHALVR